MQINDKKCVKTHYRIRLTDLLFLFKQKKPAFFLTDSLFTPHFFQFYGIVVYWELLSLQIQKSMLNFCIFVFHFLFTKTVKL